MLPKLFLWNNEILPCSEIQVSSVIVNSLPPFNHSHKIIPHKTVSHRWLRRLPCDPTMIPNEPLMALENTEWLFFFYSVPVVSPSCPNLLLGITRIVTASNYWSLGYVFWEACLTVNWFAWSRLERYRCHITTIGTFNFKHRFRVHYSHLYSLWALIEKQIFNYH